MGFLTNAAQEHQLAGDDYQNTIVQALVDAVQRFRGVAMPGGTK
jgi:N-acetylmuramoyl-L-alanine amidase